MLIKVPEIRMEDDKARNETIREIENPNTDPKRAQFLTFQLNLYDVIMGYKYEIR